MYEWVKIKDISHYDGKKITLKGWLYNKRSSGKIHFLQIRDGTGFIQCVMVKTDKNADEFETANKLRQEATVIVRGAVRKDERAPSGYEVDLENVDVLFNPSEPYPISKKSHGVDFLMKNRHLWLRSRRQLHVIRIRNEVVKAIRDYFYDRGFLLIDSPILTGSIGETASSLFQLDYFDLGKAYLSQTGQLYLEAATSAYGNVFCFGPTFRAEKSKTRRHLTEFWMIEAEMAFCDSECNMKLQEDLVSYVVQRVIEKNAIDLKALNRDTSILENTQVPFYRISYDDAITLLQKKSFDIEWGNDIGGDEETAISDEFDKPVMVYNYPKKAKAFYMQPHPERSDVVLCDDMLAPEGYGEIIGGSQRIDDFETLLNAIRDNGLSEEAYRWYLDLRKWGSVVHSGFGLGIERMTAWICGLEHIREAIPFARTIYRIYP